MPWATTIVTGVFVALWAMIGDAGETYDLTNIGTLFAFVLVCIGVLVLRYKDPSRACGRSSVPFVWPVSLGGAAVVRVPDVRPAARHLDPVRRLAGDRTRGLPLLRRPAFGDAPGARLENRSRSPGSRGETPPAAIPTRFGRDGLMRHLASALAGVVIGVRAVSAQPAEPTEAHMRTVAERIVVLEASRQEATGTVATIDSLLSMYSDSVVYEDAETGSVVRGKGAMRKLMLQYLGSIRRVAASSARMMVGHRVVVVETATRMEILQARTWVPMSRNQIRVIEFGADGLVRRILDYPG